MASGWICPPKPVNQPVHQTETNQAPGNQSQRTPALPGALFVRLPRKACLHEL